MSSSQEEEEEEDGNADEQVLIACTAFGCTLAFTSKYEQREHWRSVHQSSLMWQPKGTREGITVHRVNGVFTCPRGCGYEHKLPRIFQRHPDCGGLPSQVVAQQELLERYDMTIDQETRVLTCAKCHIGVPKSEAADHILTVHGLQQLSTARLGKLLTVLNPLASLAVKVDHAVPGIAVRDGYQCPHCSEYCCLKVKSLQKHCREKHPGLQVPPNNYPGCRVQSLNGQRNWYRVSAPMKQHGNGELPAELQQLAQTARDQLAAASGVPGQVSDDASGSFLKIHVLSGALEELGVQEVQRLVSLELLEGEQSWAPLRLLCLSFVESSRALCQELPHAVCQLIGTHADEGVNSEA